jgi:hypothetical protein
MNWKSSNKLLCALVLLMAQASFASPAAVRASVVAARPSVAEIPGFLIERVRELKALNLAVEVPDQAALIPVLAADMRRKNTGQQQDWSLAAKSQIDGNNTTALTTSDDHYVYIKGGYPFDEIHEFVHILSGPGGESPLHAFKLQFNEGAINYFAVLAARAAGVPIVVRYQKETQVVQALVNLIGAQGPELLFDAAFKGKIDEFYEAAGLAFVNLKDGKRPNGTNKAFSEKAWDAATAGQAFKSKAKNWDAAWILART